MNILYGVIVFVFGLTIGSFLNVCIYRMPRGESIVSPGSHCPDCNHPLGVWDLIPLISFIALGMKCRYCKKEISARYFFVELGTGVMFLAVFARFFIYENNPLAFVSYLVLCSALIVITFIDLEHKIIPDKITYPGMIAGIFISIFTRSFLPSVLGLLIGGGILLFIVVVSRGGMGGGDVKLAAMLGAFLGWKLIFLNLFLAFLLGGIAAVILLIMKKKGRKDYIPFGPYLAIAGMITVFWGDRLLSIFLPFLAQTH